MTFHLEKKSVRYLAFLALILFMLLTTLPYSMLVIGMVGASCMLVAAFIIVPLFFIGSMLSGKDYKK